MMNRCQKLRCVVTTLTIVSAVMHFLVVVESGCAADIPSAVDRKIEFARDVQPLLLRPRNGHRAGEEW